MARFSQPSLSYAVCLSFTLLGARAAKADLPVAAPQDESARVTAAPSKVGLMFDVGSSDGGMLSAVLRPDAWWRVHAGFGTNGMAPGVRGGFVALPWGPGPSLSLEAGHFFPGNVNGLMQVLTGPDYRSLEELEHFDYDFVNLHAGFEIEQSGVMFFAHGGLTYLWSRLDAIGEDASTRLTGATLSIQGNSLRLLMPSLKLGFVGFL